MTDTAGGPLLARSSPALAASSPAPVSALGTGTGTGSPQPQSQQPPQSQQQPQHGGMVSVRAVSEHEEMNPACRNTMEDAHLVVDGFGGVEEQGLFAVFDGHGGRGVVDYLSKHFQRILRAELQCRQGGRPVEECFTSAFLIADVETSQHNLSISGSTAVVCLVRSEPELGRVLYCANVGDSRAVLCRAAVATSPSPSPSPSPAGMGGVSGQNFFSATRLSVDHKASDPVEMKRIEDAGGFILRKRVLGILSVSRSFGDHAMKKFVVARPFTSRTVLGPRGSASAGASAGVDADAGADARSPSPGGEEFVIIACDGVWDVMSDQEAADFVSEAMAKLGSNTTDLAKMLVSHALECGSTDNVTALVVLL